MEQTIVLVGGGLHNCLLALALLHRQPDLPLTLIERAPAVGGNHTWSFHPDDVPPSAGPWLAPLVAHRWDAYEVRFPHHQRVLPHAYGAISSVRLAEVIAARFSAAPAAHLLTGCPVVNLSRDRVVLQDGREFAAAQVIDGRGLDAPESLPGCGFQKFVGLEVELVAPSGLRHPLIMDARVEQQDGYRFVYTLPLSATRLLVEETRFSDRPDLDEEALARQAGAYMAEQGWRVKQLVRTETGVLPMPYRALPPAPGPEGVGQVGLRGGWLHPATGYSLPLAARLAEAAAQHPRDLLRLLARTRRELSGQLRFAHLLNRMLFGLVPAPARWRIFERFYRLPEEVIRRFYALRTTGLDRARILLDHPPFAPWLRLPGRAGDAGGP